MFRILAVGLLALILSGCATPADRAWWRALAGLPAEPAQFDFGWQISGDPALAPLQVFDDGVRVWLQYPAGQATPALFEQAPAGERLLHPTREGSYLVVHGLPARILLRGGHLQAQVQRDADAVNDAAAGRAASAQPLAVAGPPPFVSLPQTVPPAPVPPAPASASDAPGTHPAPRPQVARRAAATLPPVPSAARQFDVTPADENLRRALGRWAHRAGWTFDTEHWAVDVDIPLAGSAAFGTEFVAAVRELLAATELGERPLQPCFYANQVLRVVPLAQRCDRTRASSAQVAPEVSQ